MSYRQFQKRAIMVRSRTVLFVALMLAALPQIAIGQVGGGIGGTGAGGAGGGAGAGGQGGNLNQTSGGIRVDADGLMTLVVTKSETEALEKKRRVAMAKELPGELNQRSKQRCVSLVKLEKELVKLVSEQKPIPNELFYLAGLQRIDHLLVFPDEGDVVVAGPADGFVQDSVGRMVGVTTGRPTLRLDDLIVAIRTVARTNTLGCSIDPVPRRLAEMREFIRKGEPAEVEIVEARFQQLDDILGLQDVRIDGVPPDSHFASLLVEADYRMKQIALGVEVPALKGLKSYLAMMDGKGFTMQRWWFVPSYDAITRSEDGLAFQLAGPRAKLLTEEEVVDENGNRSSAPVTRKSTQRFAKGFTEKFAQLADKSPVFAELQNLIDWSVIAALLMKEGIPARIGWKQDLLLDEARFHYPSFETPKKVASVVGHKRTGSAVVGMAGGVTIHPRQAYEKSLTPAKDASQISDVRANASIAHRADDNRWWWDGDPAVAATR